MTSAVPRSLPSWPTAPIAITRQMGVIGDFGLPDTNDPLDDQIPS